MTGLETRGQFAPPERCAPVRCNALIRTFVDSLLRCGVFRLHLHAGQTLASRLTFGTPVFVTIWRYPLPQGAPRSSAGQSIFICQF